MCMNQDRLTREENLEVINQLIEILEKYKKELYVEMPIYAKRQVFGFITEASSVLNLGYMKVLLKDDEGGKIIEENIPKNISANELLNTAKKILEENFDIEIAKIIESCMIFFWLQRNSAINHGVCANVDFEHSVDDSYIVHSYIKNHKEFAQIKDIYNTILDIENNGFSTNFSKGQAEKLEEYINNIPNITDKNIRNAIIDYSLNFLKSQK